MRETKARNWRIGLALLWVPLALVLCVPASGAPEEEKTGVIKMAGDDTSRVFLVGGLGKGAFLGVSLEEETELEEGGARVTHVVEDSPAARAGIEDGDVIVAFDGETIRGPVALTKKIHSKEPGDTVSLTVVRDGARRTLEAELGDRAEKWALDFMPGLEALEKLGEIRIPELPELPEIDVELQEQFLDERLGALENLGWVGCDEEDDEDCVTPWVYLSGRPRLGVQLVEVTPELRSHMGAAEDAGVLVSKVIAGTPAESAGVRVGDLIVAVDGESISGVAGLRKALRDKSGKTFELEVLRDRTPVRVQVTIPEPENEVPTGPRARLHVLPRPVAAPRAVPSAAAPPVPAAAPEAVPQPAVPAPVAPPARRREVVRAVEESREVARAEAREVREKFERERGLAVAEAREIRQRLDRERGLARAEARERLARERAQARAELREARESALRRIDEERERRQRARERHEELKRRLAGATLL